MANNKLSKIGDSIVVEIKPEINGILKITSFRDTFSGLPLNIDAGTSNSIFDVYAGDILYFTGGADTKFDKIIGGGGAIIPIKAVRREYRLLTNRMFFGIWKPLTNENIFSEEIERDTIIQIRYTRIGNDEEGDIEFIRIDLEGDYTVRILNPTPTIDSSIFADVADDPTTIELAFNLFKKLYFRGIVPQYIKRAENLDLKEDEDYVALFYTIAQFFAIVLNFFKRFENFGNDIELMREWIRQKGIYFDESDITLDQLQFFAQFLYDEIARRGTHMIFSYKGDEAPNGKTLPIDGEFIRLIRGGREYELLYENISLKNVGWCLGNSSPMYRGLNNNDIKLNKVHQDKIRIFNKNGIVVDNKNNLIQLSGNSSLSMVGIGRIDNNDDATDDLYVADPLMDYEICFNLCVKSGNGTLNFKIDGFDRLKNTLLDGFITPNNDSVSSTFLSIPLNKFISDKQYFIRGIIHAYSSEPMYESKLNIGYGTNLYFNNSFLRYILPKIYLSGIGNIEISNYTIRPLVRGTNILPLKGKRVENCFSLGFIQSNRIFHIYFRNNNNSQSQKEITNIIEKYLLPYDITDILTFINNPD